MNVINKWQKPGITFKNEVFECYHNAETYPDHPNHFDKIKCDGGEGTPPWVKQKKDRKWPCGYSMSMHLGTYRTVSSPGGYADMQVG